jgi:hypothetical protein
MCLYRLSKNVSGNILTQEQPIQQRCDQLECETQKLKQQINLERVWPGRCDSPEGHRLIGGIDVVPFVQALRVPPPTPTAPPRPPEFGIHGGEFTWSVGNVKIVGTVSGTTGADTVWRPIRDPNALDHRQCRVPGLLLGRICGTFDADGVFPKGTQVFGTYRLFVASPRDPSSPIFGAIEGVILQRC